MRLLKTFRQPCSLLYTSNEQRKSTDGIRE